MTRLRSPSATSAGAPRGAPPERRPSTVLALKIALGVCTIAACALAVPNMVFGAGESGPRPDGRPPSESSPLFTLPWGDGEGQVGLLRPVEGLTRGPEALAAAADGRMAVLDSVNRRIVFLDRLGEYVGTAEVPLAEPRFLAVDDERVYVLDCDADRLLVTMDWSGVVLATMPVPEFPDLITGLFATSEGACVEVAHDVVLLMDGARRSSSRGLAGRPVGHALDEVVELAFAPGAEARLTVYSVDKSTLTGRQRAHFAQPLAPGYELEHVVSVDGDGNGGLIVGARISDRGAGAERRASLVLTRLAAGRNGQGGLHAPVDVGASDVLLLADSSYAYLGQPYVVTPGGRVLQPIGSDAGYSVFVHSFDRAGSPGRIMEVQP